MRVVLLAAIGVVALAGVGGASPASKEAMDGYCLKPIGEYYRDICYAVNRKTTTGAYGLSLSMHERYFSRYGVCIRRLGEKRICRTFPVHQMGIYSPRWGGYRKWERNFPPPRPGRYWVTWWEGGHRLGRALTFSVPAT